MLHAVGPSTKPETDPVFTAEATNLLGAGIFRLAKPAGRHRVRGGDHQGPVRAPERRRAADDVVAATGVPTGEGGKALPCTDTVWTPPAGGQQGRLWAALLRPDSGQMELRWRSDGGRHLHAGRRCRPGAGGSSAR